MTRSRSRRPRDRTEQTFTVPTGVTSLSVVLVGAAGGGGGADGSTTGSHGGNGTAGASGGGGAPATVGAGGGGGGLFGGTPTKAGLWPFTIKVTDHDGNSAQKRFFLKIDRAVRRPKRRHPLVTDHPHGAPMS